MKKSGLTSQRETRRQGAVVIPSKEVIDDKEGPNPGGKRSNNGARASINSEEGKDVIISPPRGHLSGGETHLI